jgi:hypothetical protein
MKTLAIVGLVILTAGCSSHSVRCHGTLQPINAPAAADKAPRKGTPAPSGIHP